MLASAKLAADASWMNPATTATMPIVPTAPIRMPKRRGVRDGTALAAAYAPSSSVASAQGGERKPQREDHHAHGVDQTLHPRADQTGGDRDGDRRTQRCSAESRAKLGDDAPPADSTAATPSSPVSAATVSTKLWA